MLPEFYTAQDDEVRVDIGQAVLAGNLTISRDQNGIVLFAHGSGSGRHSRRNLHVAKDSPRGGLGDAAI